MLSRHRVGTYQESELTRNSSANARPQSSPPSHLWASVSVACPSDPKMTVMLDGSMYTEVAL